MVWWFSLSIAAPPFADGQIAAVAAVNDLTLVTLNPRDFERFEAIRADSGGGVERGG